MIIFGSKVSEIKGEKISETCQSCGKGGTVEMFIFQKYAHIFYIPLFPFGKTGVTQCTHCKQVLEKKQFSRNLQMTYENIKSTSKTPVWTFAGLALFVVFVGWGGINSKQKDEKNAGLIQSPQKGDVYEIKIDRKQYTLYKVDRVSEDTVFVLLNLYETNKARGLGDLKKKGDLAYDSLSLPFLKEELKNMLETEEIIDIER